MHSGVLFVVGLVNRLPLFKPGVEFLKAFYASNQ